MIVPLYFWQVVVRLLEQSVSVGFYHDFELLVKLVLVVVGKRPDDHDEVLDDGGNVVHVGRGWL